MRSRRRFRVSSPLFVEGRVSTRHRIVHRLSRLSRSLRQPGCEIHIYSQSIQGSPRFFDLSDPPVPPRLPKRRSLAPDSHPDPAGAASVKFSLVCSRQPGIRWYPAKVVGYFASISGLFPGNQLQGFGRNCCSYRRFLLLRLVHGRFGAFVMLRCPVVPILIHRILIPPALIMGPRKPYHRNLGQSGCRRSLTRETHPPFLPGRMLPYSKRGRSARI